MAELDRARRQIQQYQIDIQDFEQRQSKAQRVLQRLQTEYEARIAVRSIEKNFHWNFLFFFQHLVEQQQQQLVDFENYQHEVKDILRQSTWNIVF